MPPVEPPDQEPVRPLNPGPRFHLGTDQGAFALPGPIDQRAFVPFGNQIRGAAPLNPGRHFGPAPTKADPWDSLHYRRARVDERNG